MIYLPDAPLMYYTTNDQKLYVFGSLESAYVLIGDEKATQKVVYYMSNYIPQD